MRVSLKESVFGILLCCNMMLLVSSAIFTHVPPPLVKSEIGENVTFLWNFTLAAGQTVLLMTLYYTDTSSLATSSTRIGHGIHLDPPFQGRARLGPYGVLTLFNVGVDDQGLYKCRVELDFGSALSSETQLLVGATPIIEPFPEIDLEVLEGRNLKLDCVVSGYPPPKIVWYKRAPQSADKIIGNNVSLELKNTTSSHSGEYHCSATNHMGGDDVLLNIEVYARPRAIFFSHTASLDGTIYECQDVTFICDAFDNQPPVTAYNFYHNNTLLIKESKTGEFAINGVRKKDGGTYSCAPLNKVGEGFNKTIELKVIDAPRNCKTTDSPLLEVTDLRSTVTPLISTEPNKRTHVIGSPGKRSASITNHPTAITVILATLLFFICV